MTEYWLLFSIPVLGIWLSPARNFLNCKYSYITFCIIAWLLIGFRDGVGGDWLPYLQYVELAAKYDFIKSVSINDPGYMGINWISANLGLGIRGVNLFCGAVLMFGLYHFCIKQPAPWIGFLVATPYNIIIVGMGYTRQASALGILFYAFSRFNQISIAKINGLTILSSLFHKTSALFLLLFFLCRPKKYFIKIILMAIFFFIFLGYITTQGAINHLFSAYLLNDNFNSRGALIRILMNVIPSLIWLLFLKDFSKFNDASLWNLIAVLNLIMLVFVFIFPTAIDRFAIYLTGIQVAVYSRLPYVIKDTAIKSAIVFNITIAYASILFIWLNFSFHAHEWVPYKWQLF